MTGYTCIRCREAKWPEDMMHVRCKDGTYQRRTVCRVCEGDRRRSRKGTVNRRPRPTPAYQPRPSGWLPPPSASQLAQIHTRARGLRQTSRWGIIDPIGIEE